MRRQGITSFAGGKIYMKLKSRRISKYRNKRWDHYERRIDWRKQIPGYISGNAILLENDPVIPLVPTRKKSLPLDIIGEFASYSNLNSFLSTIDFIPSRTPRLRFTHG